MPDNDRLLKTLQLQPTDRPPVWMMRQAGRYLPEYRQLRQKAGSFLDLCQNPEWACEITLQPIRRFGLDAAILFCDILTIPYAMNLGLEFVPGKGPVIHHPVRNEADVHSLPPIDINASLGFVADAIQLVKRELADSIPLIGFAGSPWTVATYMVEGGSSKTYSQIKSMLYARPELLTTLMDKITQATSDYLLAQCHAGADSLMIFDTWGGVLEPVAYQQFSMHFMQQVVQNVKAHYPHVPVTLFSKQVPHSLPQLAQTGCDALGIDWTVPMTTARRLTQDQVALQGNIDPSVLYAPPKVIEQKTRQLCDAMSDFPGHIMNLGHGVYPDIPVEHVQAFVETVKHYSF